jgi:hypothetical protein
MGAGGMSPSLVQGFLMEVCAARLEVRPAGVCGAAGRNTAAGAPGDCVVVGALGIGFAVGSGFKRFNMGNSVGNSVYEFQAAPTTRIYIQSPNRWAVARTTLLHCTKTSALHARIFFQRLIRCVCFLPLNL